MGLGVIFVSVPPLKSIARMFVPDILSLRQFYATPFGEEVRSLIAAGITELWPDAKGDTLLGIGYATPYLGAYTGKNAPVVACMPARQGAVSWPSTAGNMA